MAAVTIRNIRDATHRGLKMRAARNGRSTEAEIRDILDRAVANSEGVKIGTLLAQIGQELGGIELEIRRDKTPIRDIDFE